MAVLCLPKNVRRMSITKEVFESGMTYAAYRAMTAELAANGATTGEQTPDHIHFTELNEHRMRRLDRTFEVDAGLAERLKAMSCTVHWLVLTESWCGDAAQNVPVLAKMANLAPGIHLRLLLRDEHTDIIDQFLTNGGRAIPKLIIMDAAMKVIGTWGPRPREIQDRVMENKRTGAMPYSEFAVIVQKWYAQDKGRCLQREMAEVLETAGCFGRLEKV